VASQMGQGRECSKMASALRSESVDGGDLSRLVASKIDSTRNEHVLDMRSKIFKDPMVNTASSLELD
jgi:hypothetical protein